jgi:hypothetical protein
MIKDFTHIPGELPDVTEADVQRMVAKYKEMREKFSEKDKNKMAEINYNTLEEYDFNKMVLVKPDNSEIHGTVVTDRVDITTIPEGKYAYYIRSLSYKDFPMTIEKGHVDVDLYGTFLCDEPLDFNGKDYVDVMSEKSEWFLHREYA